MVVGIEAPAQKRRLVPLVAKAENPRAGVRAAGIPADDVEAPAADRVDTCGVALHQADAGDHRARPG